MKPLLIAVAGASGSGKTTVANALLQGIQSQGLTATLFSQDNFYNPIGHPLSNYDEPQALELDLLAKKLNELKQGLATEIPTYDFVVHRRQQETLIIEPLDVILVEGLFLLSQPNLVSAFDIKIYLDVPQEICFQRRFERDQIERGREPDDIRRQYNDQVRPGFERHIAPYRDQADIRIDALPSDVKSFIKNRLNLPR
ncbi:Uridine kinase [Marinobacterium sp. xm-a-121]|uniref:uridine kinase family protein n=1 Tax=unclassified Marinobacterium TaxID=2644139 RepID=UPI001568CD9C|nr:Uridine kinase [Marinobacterium sp. xm-a-121]NRP94020.1 Uridine kinase [Marinobacterium sp. xm-g-59]NRQ00222.1 Uridine kinase [Marinobacterium sp. xm-v-233]